MEEQKNIRFDDLTKLKNTITESYRAEKKNISELQYVEISNNLDTVSTKANFIIFGRRGTGKNMLLRNIHLKSKNSKIYYSIFIDCETIKKYPYPDIIIFILKRIFEEVHNSLGNAIPFSFKSKLKAKITKEIKELENKLKQQDYQEITKKEEKEMSSDISGAISDISGAIVTASSNLGSKEKATSEFKQTEVKIKYLDRKIPDFQNIIDESMVALKKERLYILIDDFYFINNDIQFKLIDFVHKLCKNACANFKLATIKHRSKIYERSEKGTYGVQGVADFKAVDLDYTLDRPELSEQFMKKILINLLKKSGAQISIEELFTSGDNGFKRLVWASGGVPRDFLNIFTYALDEILMENEKFQKIGKDRINSATVKYNQEKLNEFNARIFQDGQVIRLFNWIKEECLEKNKVTAFLIKKNSLGKNGLLSLFNNLIDFRLIHLIRENETQKRRAGEVFEAYILDMGVYAAELRLRKNIYELDIFEKGEKKSDSPFRSRAPILDLMLFQGNFSQKAI